MLTSLRGATGGIIAKSFLVLLAGSFAVWGVADVFNGSRDQTLAKVGEREIGAQEFRRYFDQRLLQISQSSSQSFTADQARKLGLDRQILGDLIRSSSFDEKARQLKMSLSTSLITKTIAGDPRFQDSSGNFDAANLRQRLAQNNLSEAQFVASQRSNMIRSVFTDAANQGLNTPSTLVEIVSREVNEKRDVKYFTISGKDITIADPDAKTVEEFYNNNKRLFAIPERRVLEIITIDAATLGKDIAIPEADLKAFYQERRNTFGSPETRKIQQIPFASIEKAQEAQKQIKDGKSFDDIAKAKGLSDKDKELGTFSKKDVPDPAIAAAAFGLDKDQVSGPVQGRLSVFLIRVSEISPEKIKTYTEVRDQIVKLLQSNKGRDLILALRDKIEDERGAGTSFADIAKSLSLPYRKIAPVDGRGLDEKGKAIEGITDWSKILQAGFASQAGLEIDPIATSNDGFTWLNVSEVISTHVEPLKDAKQKAIELWKAKQVRTALDKKAKELTVQLNGGAKMEDLAKKAASEIKTQLGISRRTLSAEIERSDVTALFQVAPDGLAYSVSADGKTAKIMQSSPVLSAPFDPNSKESKQIAKQLSGLIKNDVLAGYVVQMQKSVGVQINQKAWSGVFQSSSP